MLLTKHFSQITTEKIATENTTSNVDTVLTTNELNVLQYVGGFIPYVLLKKFKPDSTKYQQYIECLGEMAVDGDNLTVY